MIDEKGTADNNAPENEAGSNEEQVKKQVADQEEAKSPEATSEQTEETAESAKVEAAQDSDQESTAKPSGASQEESSDSEGEEYNQEDGDEEDEHEEEVDYTNFSKEELVEVIKELAKSDNFRKTDKVVKEIKPLFDEIKEQERQEALAKFKEEGGDEGDFAFKNDELTDRFEANYQLIRDRKSKYYKEQERQREDNLAKKNDVLDRLRELVDGEETVTSINVIKDIQQEWKNIGQVPPQHVKTLWANYNALMDRFYDQRSIHFELKELDRKKNLSAKLELCEKAEELAQLEDVTAAVKALNELHEEFKHIGPVPKEDQEPLWQRFKAASDAIYDKRKEFVKELKVELEENLVKKQALVEELKPFLEFDSDRIKEWNAKTKEILDLQKRWEAIGGMPREHAKEVNKAFWGSFKEFFSNKHKFFKKLDAMREENLKRKEELVKTAEELQDSTEWGKTAERLKQLQRQWKDIGPVPEKHRDSVYKKFKAACDTFFNNKRAENNEAEKDFQANLKAKEDIVNQIELLAKDSPGDLEQLEAYEEAYSKIGFVPKGAIQDIKEKFSKAVNAFVEASEDKLSEEQLQKVKIMAQITKIMSGPNSDRKLNQKENSIRKKIGDIQNDITTWKTNMEFFASSKTADKLKVEFEEKIEKAEKEIELLKQQLRIVRSVD
jgi:hypothetical protein